MVTGGGGKKKDRHGGEGRGGTKISKEFPQYDGEKK